MSTTDVPNGNISFLKGVRQVVLTPLLCQLTHLSSFVLPAQRRTEGCRAVLVKLRVPPARTTCFILLLIIFDYTSIRRMETESPCLTKNMGLFGEWRRNLHKFSSVLTCFGEWRRNLHEFSSVLTCLGEWRRILHQKAKVSFYFPSSDVFFSPTLFKRKTFCHSGFSHSF